MSTVLHGISDALALRQGDWKFIPATAKDKAGGMGSGADSSDARFAAARITEPLLFNLATDPNEKSNLFARHPEKARELAKRLETIFAKGALPKQTEANH